MRRMIFHIPNKINTTNSSGSQIRPIMMLNAFKNIGYDVDVVMGYGSERKKQIEKIINNIKFGIKYDFMYAENSTMPSILTEKNHLPLYPLMDFKFMEFCKSNGIKIGLFYRDIYWAFDEFMDELEWWKAAVIKVFSKYDLWWYRKVLDVLYLPSKEMYKYIPGGVQCAVNALPPAIQQENCEVAETSHKNINIFYVGGIGNHYNLELFCKVVSKFKNINFTLCCRPKEWENERKKYEKYLESGNINIVHSSGNELEQYYKNADITNLYLEPYIYREFAMPVKLFEYMSFKKPIIASNGTACGNFVKQHNVGWSIEFTEEALTDFFEKLTIKDINDKKTNIVEIYEMHTWEARARQVAEELYAKDINVG